MMGTITVWLDIVWQMDFNMYQAQDVEILGP